MITTIAVSIIIVSLCFSVLYATLIVLHNKRIPAHNLNLPYYPKVNIFITLKNLDDGLEENLISVFSLDYPDYDVYCAVDTMDDPCMDTLTRVCARFPAIKSTIVAAGHSFVNNPKVSKLTQLEQKSNAPLMWILDSDIRVYPQTLRSLVSEYIRYDARIVFCPIRCSGAKTFGSLLEMSYINFFMAGSILAAWDLMRKRVIVGKSLLIERQTLDQFGGFAYFADVLAEDHQLGETFSQSGFPVHCSYTWVDNIKETTTVKTYIARMSRWAKLRFNLCLPVYLLEILFNPVALVLLFFPLLNTVALPLVAFVVSLRIVLEYIVLFSVNDSDNRRISVLLGLAPAAIAKDLLLLFVYFLPFFSKSVMWRGGTIQIGKYTLIAFNRENLLYDGA